MPTGIFFEQTTESVPLHDFFFRTDMALEYMTMLHGLTAHGKSKFIEAFASGISDRDGYEKLAFVKKSLDQMGACACTDLDLVT